MSDRSWTGLLNGTNVLKGHLPRIGADISVAATAPKLDIQFDVSV